MRKASESGQAFEKASESSRRAAEAAKQVSREQEKSAAAGARLAESLIRGNESLRESYARQKEAVQTAFNSGKISADKLRDAVSVLDGEIEELGKAEKATGKEGTAAMEQFRRKIKDVGIVTDEAKNKQTGWMTSAGSKLVEHLGTWISIATAIRGATLAAELYTQEAERGAETLRQSERGMMDLATVSDSQRELIERVKQAEMIQKQSGISVEKSAGLVFALDSAGLIGEGKDIAANNQVAQYFGGLSDMTDASTMINLAGQSQASFGINYQQAVNVGLASAEKTKLNPAELAKQIATASQGTGLMHSNDQLTQAVETAAITSILSVTGDTTAGTTVKAASIKLADAFKGDNLFSAAKKANALDPESYKTMFGDNEQLKILLDLVATKDAEIESFIQVVRSAADNAGSDKSFVSTKRKMISENPVLSALKEERVAKERANVSAQKAGMIRLKNSTLYEESQAGVSSGKGFFQESLGGALRQPFDLIGSNPIASGDDIASYTRNTVAPLDRLGNYMAFGWANTFGNQVRKSEEKPEFSAAMRDFYQLEQQQAERRHQELLRSNRPPTITKPGDDN